MDKKFIEKAQKELGEDENKRRQCLEQLREWISKTPILKGARQGQLHGESDAW
jgi:predicted RNA binding protein with dsRBD fold (UPF0201 family)